MGCDSMGIGAERAGDIVVFVVPARSRDAASHPRFRQLARRWAVRWIGANPRLQRGVAAYRFDVHVDGEVIRDAF